MTLKLGPDAAPSSGADAQAEAEIRAEAARQERIAREAEELEALRAFKAKVETGGADVEGTANAVERERRRLAAPVVTTSEANPIQELEGILKKSLEAGASPDYAAVAYPEPRLKARVRLEKGSRVLLPWTTQQNSFKDVLEEGVDFGQLWMDSGFVCMAEPNGGARSVSVHGSHIRQIDYA
ncbi:MAG: hypothetical protein KC492_34065 [Myxococcales bacterium]|nr:hypothetical protein [Myxococcales bacterium]